MRIIRNETLFLAIDFQERLVPAMDKNEELIHNTSKLFKGMKALDIPIIISQQYTKGLGMTVKEIQDIMGEEFSYFDKVEFSCVDNEAVYQAIKAHNKKTIIVAGIEAHVCVLQSLVDLIEKGYKVMIIKDCISSRKQGDMEAALERASKEGAMVGTCESILFELTRKAGSQTFKTISKIIK